MAAIPYFAPECRPFEASPIAAARWNLSKRLMWGGKPTFRFEEGPRQ